MQIKVTNNQSKITFCNMQFQNVKEWSVEDKNTSLTNSFESQTYPTEAGNQILEMGELNSSEIQTNTF